MIAIPTLQLVRLSGTGYLSVWLERLRRVLGSTEAAVELPRVSWHALRVALVRAGSRWASTSSAWMRISGLAGFTDRDHKSAPRCHLRVETGERCS